MNKPPTLSRRLRAILTIVLPLTCTTTHLLADNPVSWSAAVSGPWLDGSYWSTNAVPNSTSDVSIAVTGSPYQITLDKTFPFVNTLNISSPDAKLAINGAVSQSVLEVSNGFTMSGGTIDIGGSTSDTAFLRTPAASSMSGGTINVLSYGFIIGRSSVGAGVPGSLYLDGPETSLHLKGGSLNSLTLGNTNGATITAEAPYGSYTLFNEVTLDNAAIDIQSSELNFYTTTPSPTLAGSATVTFNGTATSNWLRSAVYHNLPAGITFQTGNAGGNISFPTSFTIQGKISAKTAGTTITIWGGTVNSTGTLEAINGATLNIHGGTNSTGILNAGDASTVILQNPATLNGGTVTGHGTITGTLLAGTAAHTIAPSAGQSPSTTGTLTASKLTTNANTALAFNLVTPDTNDALNITTTNGLTLGGGQVQIANAPNTAASLGYYKIIQYAGAIQGTGLDSLTLPAIANNIAYTLDTSTTPNFITLHRGYLGDTNDDGTVNFADFVALSNNYGQNNTSWLTGDFNNDHTTNFADFVLLSNHYGQSIAGNAFIATPDELAAMNAFAAANAVPEPASLALLAVGALALLTRKRKS
jgi:hypothetical protein